MLILKFEFGDNTSIKIFKENIDEMANLSMREKIPYSGEVRLKDLPIDNIQENVVILRNDKATFFPAGFTLVYFMDNDESVELMKKGSLPYLMVPRGTFYSGGSPITDIWKKKFQTPGTEHILGVLEGISNSEEIFVDMVTVRPGWQRNNIATSMVSALKKLFPKAKVTTSGQTDKGKKFFNTIKETVDQRNVSGKHFHVKFDEPPVDWVQSDKIGIVYFGDKTDKVHFANTYVNDWTVSGKPAWIINRHTGATEMGLDDVSKEEFKKLEDLVSFLDKWYEEKFGEALKEDINSDFTWITGLTNDALETVSEKYSGHINNVSHVKLQIKNSQKFTPDHAIAWRYVYAGNFLNMWESPTDEQRDEIYSHLKNKYGVDPKSAHLIPAKKNMYTPNSDDSIAEFKQMMFERHLFPMAQV